MIYARSRTTKKVNEDIFQCIRILFFFSFFTIENEFYRCRLVPTKNNRVSMIFKIHFCFELCVCGHALHLYGQVMVHLQRCSIENSLPV